MRVLFLMIIAVLGCELAMAADSNRIIALEQDVRNLERLVGNLEREVRELRRQPRSGRTDALETTDRSAFLSDAWLSAAKWKQVTLGAGEMEVIEILGPPTSMRVEDGSRVLLYAMEIGSNGFLSGSVTLQDRVVTKIEIPSLK